MIVIVGCDWESIVMRVDGVNIGSIPHSYLTLLSGVNSPIRKRVHYMSNMWGLRGGDRDESLYC